MSFSRSAALRIQTPEGIEFSLPLAGPLSRAMAWLIDLAVILAAQSGVNSILGRVGALQPDAAAAVLILGYFILSIGYGIVLEWWWRGQTIGKKMLRLRVMDERGLHLHFSQIFVRNLLRFVDLFPFFYFTGGLVALLSPQGQRLGDLAANTVVVRTERVREPDLDQVVAGKFNSFRAFPHLEARLRQRISTAEASLAVQALLRRDAFDDDPRRELFQRLSEHFMTTVPFPGEAVDGLSDEQIVRNVVDSLYRVATQRT